MIEVEFSDLVKDLQVNARKNPFFSIASIIIVGGLLEENTSNLLSFLDEIKLEYLCSELISMGFRFETNTVKLCNLEYGDDFIRDTPTADLVLFHWVNNGVSNPNDRSIGRESPLLLQGHQWVDALRISNSPLIGIFSDQATCVSTRDLPEGRYVHLPTDCDTWSSLHRRADIALGL